jgi:hypothetical protein
MMVPGVFFSRIFFAGFLALLMNQDAQETGQSQRGRRFRGIR